MPGRILTPERREPTAKVEQLFTLYDKGHITRQDLIAQIVDFIVDGCPAKPAKKPEFWKSGTACVYCGEETGVCEHICRDCDRYVETGTCLEGRCERCCAGTCLE